MEGAYEILALGHVDSGFAAYARIHLGEERGRYLDEIDSPAEDGSCEARQVADHPAAQSDDHIPALDPVVEKRGAQAFGLGKGLGRLTGGQDYRGRLHARRRQSFL